MWNYIIFITYLYLILFSILGYGYILNSIFLTNENKKINLAKISFFGLFLISALSIITSFVFSHNLIFNLFILSVGILSFFYFKPYKENRKDFKTLALLIILYISGLLIFKTHDDFGYYHLNYVRFLTENSLFAGMGNLGHGFRTPSSLFFINSLFVLPFIDFFSFHFSIFYIFIFSLFFFLKKIFFYLKYKKNLFLIFFSIFSYIYISNVFYRLGAHGIDRSAQILLFVLVLLIFELIFFKKIKKENINKNFNLLLILLTFTASLKALFFIYFLPLVLFLREILSLNFFKEKYKILFICFFYISLIFSINFLNTGCALYPAKFTCLDKLSWSIPSDQVQKMKTHYEWWAKAGGGPGYKHNLAKEDYIKNFNWFGNWINRHFFNKISDNLLSTLVISMIIFLASIYSRQKIINYKNNFNYFKEILFLLIIYLIIFLEWFLFHPAMRYGGFVIVTLPFVIFFSYLFSKKNYHINKLNKSVKILIILSILIFNLQNIKRIKNEIKKYDFKPLVSPFFYLPKVKYETQTINNINFYKPINNMCWATPTPCASSFQYSVSKNFLNIIKREK